MGVIRNENAAALLFRDTQQQGKYSRSDITIERVTVHVLQPVDRKTSSSPRGISMKPAKKCVVTISFIHAAMECC